MVGCCLFYEPILHLETNTVQLAAKQDILNGPYP